MSMETISGTYGERVTTGLAGLDRILNGGLLRGSAYIIQGSPGAGKTILANQIAFHRAQAGGESVLYLTLLSESHAQMFVHLQSLGFFDRRLIPARIYYSSGYSTLDEGGLDALMALIVHELQRLKARFLVLDGLFVAHALADTENTFRRFVHELQGQLSMAGATALLLTNERRDPSSPEYTMVDGWIELGEVASGAWAARTLQVRKMRGSHFLVGQHKLRITDQGIAVFPRLEAAITRPTAPPPAQGQRLSTGITAFDALLHGGLPAASTTLVHGPSGSGKTTMGLHFLSLASKEEPGLLFGFYEGREVLCERAARLGMDLPRLVKEGVVEILWRPPTEQLADELGHELLENVRRRGVRRLFLDGLGSLREAFVHQQRAHPFLSALSNELRRLGVTSLLTTEASQQLGTDTARLEEVSALMDNLILLRHAYEGRALRWQLSILKVRGSPFDPFLRDFVIGGTGITVAEDRRAFPAPAAPAPPPGGGSWD